MYRPGVHPVSIDRLISPLRYDIVVRADFFRFLEDRWEMLDQDFDACVSASRDHHYFAWFTEVHCRRLHPALLKDAATFDMAFRWRIRQSAELLYRFRTVGFAAWTPIVLHRGGRIGPCPTGKTVVRSLYAGDGCHRLALLRLTGRRWLSPEMYVVRTHRAYSPPDNTATLLQHLSIPEQEYVRFLSLGFSDSIHETRIGLLADVREHRPDRLPELKEVMRLDEELAAGRSVT